MNKPFNSTKAEAERKAQESRVGCETNLTQRILIAILEHAERAENERLEGMLQTLGAKFEAVIKNQEDHFDLLLRIAESLEKQSVKPKRPPSAYNIFFASEIKKKTPIAEIGKKWREEKCKQK